MSGAIPLDTALTRIPSIQTFELSTYTKLANSAPTSGFLSFDGFRERCACFVEVIERLPQERRILLTQTPGGIHLCERALDRIARAGVRIDSHWREL
jgi:hypothetical protein